MRRVAVTGMGVLSPVGNSVAEFRGGIMGGRCGVGPITKFDAAQFKVKVAAELKGFDPLDYMDKLDAQHSDIYAQYAIAAAAQAVTDSGVAGTVEPERFGVRFGGGIGGISTFMTEHTKLLERGPRRVSPFFIPMLITNMAPGLIAIRHGCKGPCHAVTTACASGCDAIGEAMRMIRDGYADAMIAGGSEAAINELAVAGFANMQALSTAENPLEASLPFDSRRSGFVIGEGAGALVLEEYDRAVSRGATIYAELVGYGSACDAYHMTSPDPSADSAARAIADAWRETGMDTDRIYINAHGTGTPMNDSAETLAIKKALGEPLARKALVSSTKSMTGHALGAAGAIEAVACVLALREGLVPPTIGLASPDPACDLDYVPGSARRADIDVALSSSLGFGGHDACIAFRRAEV